MGLSVRRLSSRIGLSWKRGSRKIVGWNLRKLRVEQGLSQERLAFAAGIDRAYVGRVERGSENVTITTLEALAKALSVPVGSLLIEPEVGAARPSPLRSGRRAKGPEAAS